MKKSQLVLAAAVCAALSIDAVAQSNEAPSPAEQNVAAASTPAAPMTPEAMQQRMQELRQQHMEMMRSGLVGPMMGQPGRMPPPEMVQQMQEMRQQRLQGMPPMGAGRGMMMDPEIAKQVQEMRQQHMQMMATQTGEPVSAPAQEGVTPSTAAPATPESATPAVTDTAAAALPPCGKMYGGPGQHGGAYQGARQQMWAMRQQHMQTMEQRMANIENLLREMIDLQKSR